MFSIKIKSRLWIVLVLTMKGYLITLIDCEEFKEHSEIDCTPQYLDSCLNILHTMVDESLLKRMPNTELEIDALCRGFNTEMECFKGYARKCLISRERKLIETYSSGARNIFKYLCNDKYFKAEYIKRRKCIEGIQKDWDLCVTRFIKVFLEEIESKNTTKEMRILNTCCAFHGFSRCIFFPGSKKCDKDDALFLLQMSELTIDRQEYFKKCRTITNYSICLGSAVEVSFVLLLGCLAVRFFTN